MTSFVSAFLRRVGVLGDNPTAADSSESTVVAEFGIPDVVCEGCAESVDGILQPLNVDHQQIKACLTAAGFPPADA